MISHTMLVSFQDGIPEHDLDQFLSDIESTMSATGVVEAFTAQRHISTPGEDAIPAFIATAVLQFRVADRDALAALLSAPGAGDIIRTWQARRPYKVAWVNHEVSA